MTLKEKIDKVNKLNKEIDEIKSFIALAKEGQSIDEQNAKVNERNGINRFETCSISAYCSTGSQSPLYKEIITDHDTIVCLLTAGLAGVQEKLKDKTSELESLFN